AGGGCGRNARHAAGAGLRDDLLHHVHAAGAGSRHLLDPLQPAAAHRMSDASTIAAPRRRRHSVLLPGAIALLLAWTALAALGPYLAHHGPGEATNAGVFAPMS